MLQSTTKKCYKVQKNVIKYRKMLKSTKNATKLKINEKMLKVK